MFPTTLSGSVGAMSMPPGFRYADVFRCGRPRHGTPGVLSTYDRFYQKHPPMDTSRRAKIFAPFDALRGFSNAIAGKEVLYEERRELTEGEREALDRELALLRQRTPDSRAVREHPVRASLTFFQPCQDMENAAFGKRGTYQTVTGTVRRVDPLRRTVLLGEQCIQINEIISICILSTPEDSAPV